MSGQSHIRSHAHSLLPRRSLSSVAVSAAVGPAQAVASPVAVSVNA